MIIIKAHNDIPDADIQEIVLNDPIGTKELQIIFNWQFAMATAEQTKLINFLDALDHDQSDLFLDDDDWAYE